MAYPTLSTPPNYPLKEVIADGALKTISEAGYVSTRKKYTRQIVSFEVIYLMLDDTDKNALRAFYDTVENVESFSWLHPYTSITYTVRFDSVPLFELTDDQKWSCSFTLRQV